MGGTGLYFQALTRGLAPIPPVRPEHMDEAKLMLAEGGMALLLAQARAVDPQAASALQGDDTQRALRIVTVARSTGRSLSDWQKNTTPPLPEARFVSVALMPDREALYARINTRAEAMLSEAGIAEVMALTARGLAADLPVMRAIGVREIAAWQAGDQTREEALAAIQQATRRYAKRQMTFLRNQFTDWPRAADNADVMDTLAGCA